MTDGAGEKSVSKVVHISPKQSGKPSGPNALARLEKLEDAFLVALQDIRAIKAEIGNQTEGCPTLEKLLSAEEVAAYLGENERWVYQQAKANKIPAIRIGKFVKFSPSALQKWIEQRAKVLDS